MANKVDRIEIINTAIKLLDLADETIHEEKCDAFKNFRDQVFSAWLALNEVILNEGREELEKLKMKEMKQKQERARA